MDNQEKRFDILSPDGISIHPTDTYKSSEVLNVFNVWKKRFETQGYYSSAEYGKIPLCDLDDYCEVVKANIVTDDSVG